MKSIIIIILSFSLMMFFEGEILAQDNSILNRAVHLDSTISKQFKSQMLDSAFINTKELLKLATDHSLSSYEFKSYGFLGDYYMQTGEPDSSIYNFKTASEYFKLVQDTMLQAKILVKLAIIFKNKADIDTSIRYYHQGIDLLRLANDTLWFGVATNHLGMIYFKQGNYFLALRYLNSSVDAFKRLNHPLNIGSNYNSIGLVYRKTNDEQQEKESYLKAIDILEGIDESMTLGMAYNNLAEMYLEEGKDEMGFETLEKAREIYTNLDYPLGMCSYYSVLSFYYSNLNPPDHLKVIEYCEKSIPIAEEYEDYRQYADAISFLGDALLSTNQAYKAKTILEMGLSKAEEYELIPEYIKITRLLSEAHREINQPEKALYYLEKHIFYNDSILSEEKIKEFTSLDLEYKFRQQTVSDSLAQLQKDQQLSFLHQKEIQKEKQTKLIFVFISVLVVLIALFAFFMARRNKKQAAVLNEKNKMINQSLLEKELLLREVHHRVKNNFQLVSSLLELQSKDIEDSKALLTIHEGQTRVRSMAMIHQRLYQNENIASINFKEYCVQLIHELQSIYANEKTVEVRIKMGEIYFDIDTAIPLGLILNELITNAFKYAFTDATKNKLSVSIFIENGDRYLLRVEDNGIGLPEDLDISKTKSLGLRLVKRLAKQLHGSFEYENKNGSIFNISFKDTNQRSAAE